jgi:hypothetical protein
MNHKGTCPKHDQEFKQVACAHEVQARRVLLIATAELLRVLQAGSGDAQELHKLSQKHDILIRSV